MALQLSFTDQFGHDNEAGYFLWIGCAWDTTTSQAVLVFNGYTSLDAYNSGCQPVTQRQVQVSGQEFADLVTQLSPTLAPIAYQMALADPFFANATQV